MYLLHLARGAFNLKIVHALQGDPAQDVREALNRPSANVKFESQALITSRLTASSSASLFTRMYPAKPIEFTLSGSPEVASV
jgi:hypothetical protein